MNETKPDEVSIFPEADIKFASFGNRFAAMILDNIIILIIVLPVTYFNIISWKIPYLFILFSGVKVIYKPFLEYRYGATLGKMAVGIRVVGHHFENVNLNEELRRVSFYQIPEILMIILELHNYFSPEFISATNYSNFNHYVISSNPAILWLNGIVFILLIADCITFFSSSQGKSLHDQYAGTYVIEGYKN